MRSALGRACLAALALSLGACGEDQRPGLASPPAPTTAEPAATGTAVFLSARPSTFVPDRVVVDVVARGAVELHGAAFRMSWDPAALGLVSAEIGERWSKHALSVSKEAVAGQLAVAWTEKGETSIDASSDTVLGTLTFELRGGKGGALAFKTERSVLVDKRGTKLAASWRGAAVSAVGMAR